jgi:SOS-response transcriptional repressor LexA
MQETNMSATDPTTIHDGPEHEKDRLVRLVGRHALSSLDPSDPANIAFFDWLAHDARAGLRREERTAVRHAADDFAQRILGRLRVAGSAVVCAAGAPSVERRRDPARLAQAVDEAARQRMSPMLEPAVAAGVGREIWEEPCDTWVHLPDGIPSGRYVTLPVSGDSMVPLFHPGDRILVRLGDGCQTGDVIVARHPDQGYVVKRVGRLRRSTMELTSLNAAYEPMELRRSDVRIVGTVVLRWCAHAERDARAAEGPSPG